jgi:hypothetical protein
LYDRFCVKGKAQGGRIGFANGPCTPDDVAKGMKKSYTIKADSCSSNKRFKSW